MRRREFLAGLGVAALPWLGAAAEDTAMTTIRINIPGPNLMPFIPIELIPILGIDRSLGVQLAIRYLPSGVQALEDVIAGNAHFAGIAFPVLPGFYAKGRPVKTIADLSSGTPPFTVLIRNDLVKQVRSLPDLVGRSVGVPMSSGTSKTYLRVLMEMWLAGYGVKSNQVRWVPTSTNYQGMTGALVGRTVDAVFVEEPLATTLARKKFGTVLASFADPKNPAHAVGYRHLRAVIATTPDVIAVHPQRVAAVVKMIQQSLRWIHATPAPQVVAKLGIADADLARDMASAMNSNPDIFSRDGRIRPQDIESTRHFLQASSLPMPPQFDIRSLIYDAPAP